MPSTYVIGLGANLGDRAGALALAVERLLAGTELRLLARSRLYDTAPLTLPGTDGQPRYLNAAVSVAGVLEPEAVLARCLAVEASLGRERRERWGPRNIDLDVLAGLDERGELLRVEVPGLTLPHPGLIERAFALGPLLEVVPELVPRWGARLAELGAAGDVVLDPRWRSGPA